MAKKVLVIERRTLGVVCLAVGLAIVGIIAWWLQGGEIDQAAFSQRTVPEVSIVSITLEPKTISKDLQYEGVTYPACELLKAQTFTAVVNFKNTGTKELREVPVEVVLSMESKNSVTKNGVIESLAPGDVATLTFGKFPVLGDAKGKKAEAGLHQLDVRVLPNPAGGVELSNERSLLFFVDSRAKN